MLKNCSKETREALKKMSSHIDRVKTEIKSLEEQLEDKRRELKTMQKLEKMIHDSLNNRNH